MVYIIDGARTPFLKARTKPGPYYASDLAVNCSRLLLDKLNINPNQIGEVILGCALPSYDEANIARIVALRLGLNKNIPAWTVMRNCGSGMQAVDSAYKDILENRHEVVLAGGTESMSHAPLIWNDQMVNWLANFKIKNKIINFFNFRMNFLNPIFSLVHGLTDPIINMTMGQTAEELAYRYKITRSEMDEFALNSHQKLANALDNNQLDEIQPVITSKGELYAYDDGLRRDTSLEKLAKLPAFFDKPFGQVTAGNSSQITDGAAVLILASEKAVQQYNLPVLAKIKDINWSGLDPEIMGLGPVYATNPLLKRNNLLLKDMDYIEINEAFAAQVLACIKAWNSAEFGNQELDLNKLNINGGSIAMGHPIGASGARLILRLAKLLHNNNAKYGLASLCIGGGQGGAVLLEGINNG